VSDKCKRCGRSPEMHKHSEKKEHRWPRIMCSGKDLKFTGKLKNGRAS
jgi:hypothetical protein